MLEVGRAQRTVFLCQYLRSRDEQREVNSGLNVVESWNGANTQIFYGKAGDIASNRRDEQEMSVLCLHIVQAAMVYINTLMIQDVLAEPRVGNHLRAGGLPRPDTADMGARGDARRVQTQHELPPHPRPVGAAARRVEEQERRWHGNGWLWWGPWSVRASQPGSV